MARALVFENDETAFTGTVSVLVGPDEATAFADLLPMEVNGTAVALSAGVVEQWDISPGAAVGIQSSGAEAAERTVRVYAVLDMI